MFRNYLKVTFRTLLKSKATSLINILGLTIGISTCILITLYVLDELSYDRFHANAGRIFRLTELLHLPREVRPQTVTSPPMGPALLQNFPEVQKMVRLNKSSRQLAYGDVKFFDTRVWYADSTLFQIFTFPMIKGNPDKALTEPYSIVLTEKAAKRYFGDADPLGKTMALSDTITLTVTGLIADIPTNSHIQFDVVMSRSTITAVNNNQPEDNWFNNGYYTYILLPEGYDYKQLEAKFPAFLEKQMAEEKKNSGLWYDFVLQPLPFIHLHSTTPYDIGPNGNIKYVYIFSIIAILVLLIACANYVNLATARSVNRAKELGMRKVIGARRGQLIVQLLGESFLLTCIAFILAMAIVAVALPYFNTLTGKTMSAWVLMRPEVITTVVVIFLLIGVLAGAYPALLMSSFSPIKTMKNYARQGKESNLLRKGLVVFQFSMSIMLIAGTILIFRQVEFMQTQNLGIDKEQTLQFYMRSSISTKYKLIREEMGKVPGVLNATVTNFTFSDDVSNIAMLPEGANENEITSEATISVDADFLPNFRIPVVAGRNFSRDIPTDETEAFIVNESAVKKFNWGSPEGAIGKKIDWGLGKKGKVIGVVRDFNFSSLHLAIAPLIIHIVPDWYNYIALKIKGDDVPGTVSRLESRWRELGLDSPFAYSFMDQDFQKLYQAEQQTQTIIGGLASLAIFIASLGLFGLAAFMAEQRTKEIGVRKVLGATVTSIIALLSKDFLKLIAFAIVIAVPVTWYTATQWLSSFAYRTEVSWWIFVIAGLASITIALITVSFQSIRAAVANPVNSLRNE
ncbi:putative ABC transport system permease protein [Chryseolinea serpens]|uniref:Putative ABC transport system permease protein n=1 Tax=Chryseolinea serpens TaxID=947013 RepID=A0A1M5QR15_9BACT|nr:ABC transporter permease [Chryseolinea serpens]SHH16210.1 putative ABC transport system permease protein [Chryseolinea serpens]